MTPEHAAFDVFTELLRRRPVPGWQRREAERQVEARYCDTETEYRSSERDEDSEEEDEL